MRSEARAVMQACRADYDRLCGDVDSRGRAHPRLPAIPRRPAHLGLRTNAAPRAGVKDSAVSAGVAPK